MQEFSFRPEIIRLAFTWEGNTYVRFIKNDRYVLRNGYREHRIPVSQDQEYQGNQFKERQKKLEWKQTAWQDLNSKIYNMYSKTLSNLRLTSAYSKKSTVSSDSTKATVVASEGAVNGTQTLQVNKLAKSGYLTGAKLVARQQLQQAQMEKT